MRYLMLLVWMAVAVCSCFNTKYDDTEEKRLRRLADSIRADSIYRLRNIPDTTLAIYKRVAFCDTIHVVVFDRVKMLSGDEAAEYAVRHNRFGNTEKIIVNPKVLLETLKIAPGAQILLLENDNDSTEVVTEVNGKDTIKYHKHHPSFLSDGLPKEDLVQMVIHRRFIVYLKQLPKDE